VNGAEKSIDDKHKKYINEFETLCKQKNNDYKKEKGQELYSELQQFYYSEGDYDVARFKNLSYAEQKLVLEYIDKKREELPKCMQEFLSSATFCDECWEKNN
jgi:hypothetical protein